MVDGLQLAGLDEDEADEAISRLRRGEISPDSSPDVPQDMRANARRLTLRQGAG